MTYANSLHSLYVEYFDCHTTMAETVDATRFAEAAARSNEIRGIILSDGTLIDEGTMPIIEHYQESDNSPSASAT